MGDKLTMSKKERQRKALLEGIKLGSLTLREAAKRTSFSRAAVSHLKRI